MASISLARQLGQRHKSKIIVAILGVLSMDPLSAALFLIECVIKSAI